MSKKLIFIISIPPCENCLEKIKHYSTEWEIYYLCDDIRLKSNNNYLKIFKNNNILENFFSLIKMDNILIFEAYYIVMMFLKGCLTQETEKPQIPIVVKVAEQ
jgi:hypothetical protein